MSTTRRQSQGGLLSANRNNDTREKNLSPGRGKVYIRVKPTDEIANDFIKLGEDGQSITVKSLKKHPKSFLKHQISSYSFQFASILLNTDQQAMFNLTAKPALEAALNNIPGCIISCGGKGSGKSYTLNGPVGDYHQRGMIPRAINHLFQRILTSPELGIVVRVSYVEFLNEQLFDVLNAFNGMPPKELKITELKSGLIAVKHLLTPVVKDEQAALERLFMGNAQRALNPDHLLTTSVFTLWLDSDVPQPSTDEPLHSKIHFVDMATTVKFTTTNRESEEFHRLAAINRTMTVLERVLIAKEHIPYRSCPLTHMLKDSLPNRCLIAHCSFDTESLPATLGTLKFSARVQGESSDDILNLKEHKDSQILRLQKEIDDLRSQLRVRNPAISFCEPDRQERQILSETVQSYLSDAIQQFPLRSLYEVRAALQIMKDQYRSQKVAAEEQLREKYVFTVKPPEPSKVNVVQEAEKEVEVVDYTTFFPSGPTDKELWYIYRTTTGSEINDEIIERQNMISANKKELRTVALTVNELKDKIDLLKDRLSQKQENRLPPLDGVLVIDEEELQIREELAEVKQRYKAEFAIFNEKKDIEARLTAEIEEREQQLKRDFEDWTNEKDKQVVVEQEEEEEIEELLDEEERKERREYQKLMEQDPKAAPYFFAYKKIQKILAKEFRKNGTRKAPVPEEDR